MYKNILSVQIAEFNARYKRICKAYPYMSIEDKQGLAYSDMVRARGLNPDDFECLVLDPRQDSRKFQYKMECTLVYCDVFESIDRYYVKDESLFDFFKTTEVRPKEVETIISTKFTKTTKNYFIVYGLLGKENAYSIVLTDFGSLHLISVLTDEMNYTFCVEQFDAKKDKERAWVFNLAMNFLFYINAFPECVVDGVPNGVKRNPKAKVISTSDKIVSHTTVEHGFVRPHFRSGYFRHLTSDYFVNCKGKVIFIPATMVKGKAKTVISKEQV